MEKQTKVFIVDDDSTSRALILSYLEDIHYEKEIIDTYTFLNFEQDENNNIFIVDISENTQVLLGKIKEFSQKDNSFKFIATSYDINTNFIVEALRNGVDEFLNKPIIRTELISAFNKVKASKEDTDEGRGKVLSVFSNKGGLGKTTVAVNLAKSLADVYKEKVVLVDLNMHLGDVTAFLDINPAYDIQYVIDNLNNINEDSFLEMFERYKDSSMFVLADSPYREPLGAVTPQNIKSLIKALKKVFSFVVIDMNSNLDAKVQSVFDKSDMVLFVTAVNLPTIRNCQRSLEEIDRLGYKQDKFKIILNRYITSEDYKLEDVEATISRKIFWTIPNNYFAVLESVNKGITLQEHNSSSNVAQNYRQLAQDIEQVFAVTNIV